MKKILALILAVMMMMGTACLADEELPEIRFLGVALGTTIGEMEAETNKDIFAASPRYGVVPKAIDELIKGSIMLTVDELAGDAVLQESCRTVQEVAGHSCTTQRYYVRPVIDGELDMNDDHALLYAGRYQITTGLLMGEKSQSETIVKDLTEKLTQLYGTPVVEEREEEAGISISVEGAKPIMKQVSVTTWYGANNVEVVLYPSTAGSVILTYVWRDAQQLIDAACEHVVVEMPDVSNFGGL